MVPGPITSWQIEGEKVEAAKDFIFLGSQITVNSDCSHEIKTLTPWKASGWWVQNNDFTTNLDSVLKSRNIILSTGVHIVKAMVFLIAMYRCERWIINNTKELMLLNCDPGEDS